MDLEKRLSQNRSIEERREYMRLHMWVYSKLGKASYCSKDNTHKVNRYHWANISQQYHKDVRDWKQLCPSCHKKMDGVTDEFRELKRRQALGNANTSRPVDCIELNATWGSAKEAAETVGVVYKAINNCLRGRSTTAAGLHWKYSEA